MAVYSVWPAAAKIILRPYMPLSAGLHRQIIPAAKVDNQDPLKKPFGSAAVESNSQTLCMTKGSWPEAKLDYQIDGIQQSPVKRQLNLLPNSRQNNCFAVSGRTTTPNTVQLAR